MNPCSDIWYWGASEQEAVARHLTDRNRTTGAPGTPPRRAGLLRTAFVLLTAGLVKRPAEAGPAEQEETTLREDCECGEEFQYREAVLDGGEWVLRCPECGRLDRLHWLPDEARSLVLELARRRRRALLRRS